MSLTEIFNDEGLEAQRKRIGDLVAQQRDISAELEEAMTYLRDKTYHAKLFVNTLRIEYDHIFRLFRGRQTFWTINCDWEAGKQEEIKITYKNGFVESEEKAREWLQQQKDFLRGRIDENEGDLFVSGYKNPFRNAKIIQINGRYHLTFPKDLNREEERADFKLE